MKRDMDLVREILLTVEKFEPNKSYQTISIEGPWDGEQLYGHLTLVNNANLISGEFHDTNMFVIFGLTWQGHDFLDSIRDEGIWKKIKGKLAKVGGTASIEILKTLAVVAVKETLGIEDKK